MHITRKHGKPVEKGMINRWIRLGCRSYSPDVCVCIEAPFACAFV